MAAGVQLFDTMSCVACERQARRTMAASPRISRDLRPARRKGLFWCALWMAALLTLLPCASCTLEAEALPSTRTSTVPLSGDRFTPEQRGGFVTLSFQHRTQAECEQGKAITRRGQSTEYAMSRILVLIQLGRTSYILYKQTGRKVLYRYVLVDRHGCDVVVSEGNGSRSTSFVFSLTFYFNLDVPPLCVNDTAYFARPVEERKRIVPGWRMVDMIDTVCPNKLRSVLKNFLLGHVNFTFTAGDGRSTADDDSGSAARSADQDDDDDDEDSTAAAGIPLTSGMGTASSSECHDMVITPPPPPTHDLTRDMVSTLPPSRNAHSHWLHCILVMSTPCEPFLPHVGTPAPCTTGPDVTSPPMPSSASNSTSRTAEDSTTSPGEALGTAGVFDLHRVFCERIVDMARPPDGVDCSMYHPSATTAAAAATATDAEHVESSGAGSGSGTGVDDGRRLGPSVATHELLLVVCAAVGVLAVTTIIVGLMCYRTHRRRWPVHKPKKGTESEEQTIQGDELANTVVVAPVVATPSRTRGPGTGCEVFV